MLKKKFKEAKVKLNMEYNLYLKHKKRWLRKRKGMFVLIKGREIVGFYNDFSEAYQIGLKLFGNVPMLIHQILKEEPAVYTMKGEEIFVMDQHCEGNPFLKPKGGTNFELKKEMIS